MTAGKLSATIFQTSRGSNVYPAHSEGRSAADDEIIAALLELEEKSLIRSGVTRGVDGECAISTGVLAITDYGRQSLAR